LTVQLQSAVERKNIDAVRQLVEHGAPVITQDQDGKPLIHRVIGEYNPKKPSIHDEIARILIHAAPYQASQVQNSHGETSLHIAVSYGNTRIARYLLTHGADIALQTADARTAEDFASTEEIRNYLRSTAALKRAVEREDVQAVRQLVAQGASTLIADQDGNTLIHRVIRDYNPNEPTVHDEIARTLMRAALHHATRVRNRCGQTLLHNAAACGNTRIARYLLRHGAEVNAQDGRGNTALHRFRTKSMRDLLLEYHADPTIMNREGQIPMVTYPDAWYDLLAAQAQQ